MSYTVATMFRRVPSLVFCASLVAACGGDGESSVEVPGDFTIAITSGANGCNFANWDEGATSTGIRMTLAEDEEAVTATVDGLPALFLDLLQGSHVFSGDIDGGDLLLDIAGTREHDLDGCRHLVNSTLEAQLSGDVLIGTVSYTLSETAEPDCPRVVDCASVQNFNGTRPPQ